MTTELADCEEARKSSDRLREVMRKMQRRSISRSTHRDTHPLPRHSLFSFFFSYSSEKYLKHREMSLRLSFACLYFLKSSMRKTSRRVSTDAMFGDKKERRKGKKKKETRGRKIRQKREKTWKNRDESYFTTDPRRMFFESCFSRSDNRYHGFLFIDHSNSPFLSS